MNNRKDSIYDSITKEQLWLIFGISGFIGLLIYMVCYGPSLLDVTNDGWLLSGGDLMQHYVGWKAFRSSPWHFPIGMTDGLLYPDQTCVVFTDSIPLFAIFFKLLSPLLPETFQYFGIWGALTFILMGGVSGVILRKFTKNPALCVIGSVFFSFSPYVIQRMYSHTALAANWIILLAIAIWVYKPWFNTFKRKTIAWTLLLVCGSLIHIYYIPMIMIFMIFSCVQDFLDEPVPRRLRSGKQGWLWDIPMGVIAVAVDLVILYSVGAFSATASMEDGGLGAYSSNLNVFINPLGKGIFLPSLPHNPGQDEGYGYLGLGILILLGLSAILWAGTFILFVLRSIKSRNDLGQKDSRSNGGHLAGNPSAGNAFAVKRLLSALGGLIREHSFVIAMFLAWLAAFILALSPVITYGKETLRIIDYPDIILKVLNIFRSTGRFVWCCCYIFMFFAVVTLVNRIRWFLIAAPILLVTSIIQVADLGTYALARGDMASSAYREPIIESERWEELAQGKEHLTYVPFSIIKTTYDDDALYEFANFAVDHNMTVNFYMAARVYIPDRNERDGEVRQALAAGEGDTATLYILDSRETGESYGMTTEVVDGIVVGYYE